MSAHPPCTPVPGQPRLVLHNTGPEPVRARLLCAGVQTWDVWIGPAGRVSAPAFPPPRALVQAQWHNPSEQVCHEVQSPEWPLQGHWQLRWQRMAGLPCLNWSNLTGEVSAGLQISNPHGCALQMALRFSNSPYRMQWALAAGARWRLEPARLSLLVVSQGVSAECAVPQGHGSWALLSQQGAPRIVRTDDPPAQPLNDPDERP